ncbi:hypothetical protein J1614_000427 [Plenodomus biglobosus]|nr:hypothetical protein J1614_000427 [Plenodomus biglobosus]
MYSLQAVLGVGPLLDSCEGCVEGSYTVGGELLITRPSVCAFHAHACCSSTAPSLRLNWWAKRRDFPASVRYAFDSRLRARLALHPPQARPLYPGCASNHGYVPANLRLPPVTSCCAPRTSVT